MLQSLGKNRARLAEDGILAPSIARYRPLLRDTLRALKGQTASRDVQDALLDAIIDEMPADRLIFSDPRLVCIHRLVVQGPQIWAMIDRQVAALRGLFPQAEPEVFIGMRNPATLIPALFAASKFSDFPEFSENMQPHAVAWSEMLSRLRLAHPDVPVTVWCNEDTPLLWGQLLREIADVPFDYPLKGSDDLIETIMDPTGFNRLQRYLADNPAQSEIQRRRIVGAFLDRYAIDTAIEEELDLPGWTPDLIEEISLAYDDDMAEIARIPGVTLLTP
ncbi:hypothetical protein [Roseicyclus mahoneyensis]|uniref:hypothetical protein n=1 Tax=Roseicyclus mahoneyensis TaxID=164332 RepID=UPI0011B1D7BF|nr:hypothetical protein [Roseicyclus mahoneyensis]